MLSNREVLNRNVSRKNHNSNNWIAGCAVCCCNNSLYGQLNARLLCDLYRLFAIISEAFNVLYNYCCQLIYLVRPMFVLKFCRNRHKMRIIILCWLCVGFFSWMCMSQTLSKYHHVLCLAFTIKMGNKANDKNTITVRVAVVKR